jgi:hypothetical protein
MDFVQKNHKRICSESACPMDSCGEVLWDSAGLLSRIGLFPGLRIPGTDFRLFLFSFKVFEKFVQVMVKTGRQIFPGFPDFRYDGILFHSFNIIVLQG